MSIRIAVLAKIGFRHFIDKGADSRACVVLPVLTLIALNPYLVIVGAFFSRAAYAADLPCWLRLRFSVVAFVLGFAHRVSIGKQLLSGSVVGSKSNENSW